MKCPKCGNDYEGKFCSTCGFSAENMAQQAPPQPPMYPQPPIVPAPKKKGKGCLISAIVVAAVVVVIVIILMALGGKNDNTADPNTSPSSSQSQSKDQDKSQDKSQDKDQSQNTVLKMNQAGTYKDQQITVTKMERSNGKDYDNPKDGMEYIIVTVQIKNVGKTDNISYNPFYFKLKNSNGQITDGTFSTINSKNALSSGELTPGGTVSGSIIFEAPKGDKGLTLQFQGILSSTPNLEFKLS